MKLPIQKYFNIGCLELHHQTLKMLKIDDELFSYLNVQHGHIFFFIFIIIK